MRATALWLLAVSLLVRGALWAAVPPEMAGDEYGYWSRARGFEAIYADLASGRSPADPARAYGGGLWPPLHPALLGLGLWLFGEDPAVARGLVALLSAATTPLAFAIGRRIGGARAGVAAGLLHALYPSFAAYSQLLWSESTFILTLLLAVHVALGLPGADPRGRRWRSALCGACLGLAALTRVNGAAFAVAVAAWLLLALERSAPRGRLAGLVLAAALLVVSPWLAALRAVEGQWVPLSTASGYNLLRGNGTHATNADTRRAIDEYASARGIGRDRAGRALAWAEIRRAPGRFLARSAHRFRRLWTNDGFVLRHLQRVLYPPPPAGVFPWIVAGLVASYLGLVGLAGLGALSPGPAPGQRGLLLGLVAVGALLPTISVSNSRLGLPLLALLLPLAGLGAARLRASSWAARAAAAGLALANLASVATLGRPFVLQEVGSSFYREPLRRIDARFGLDTLAVDCVALRGTGDHPREVLTVRADGAYRFREPDYDGPQVRMFVPGEQRLTVYARRPEGPLRLRLRAESRGRETALEPIRRELWHRWRPTGIEGVHVQWCGYADWSEDEGAGP